MREVSSKLFLIALFFAHVVHFTDIIDERSEFPHGIPRKVCISVFFENNCGIAPSKRIPVIWNMNIQKSWTESVSWEQNCFSIDCRIVSWRLCKCATRDRSFRYSNESYSENFIHSSTLQISISAVVKVLTLRQFWSAKYISAHGRSSNSTIVSHILKFVGLFSDNFVGRFIHTKVATIQPCRQTVEYSAFLPWVRFNSHKLVPFLTYVRTLSVWFPYCICALNLEEIE